jgi:DNA-binding transcriptional LysR family regulator
LPPLNALSAFEATARLGSTVAAASELGVTHGAVSKQIALLESWLEVPLFVRSGVRLAPSLAGARYAAVLGRALDDISQATREIDESVVAAEKMVRVSTTASFASLWLLPRLGRFREANPGVEVWVSQSQSPVEIGPGGVDLALRLGRGPWPGVRVEPLMNEHLVPACSPELAPRLREPSSLSRVTLLHDEDPNTRWEYWLEAAGLGRPAWGSRGPRLGDCALVLQAAVEGQGVALARRRLAAAQLASGKLVEPFGPAVPIGNVYWLVMPARGTPMSRSAKAFAAWVRAEARH